MQRDPVVKILVGAGVALAALTLVGLVILWPEQSDLPRSPLLAPAKTERAQIRSLRDVACGQQQGLGGDCVRVTAEIQSGADEGESVEFTVAGVGDVLGIGDKIRVFKNPQPAARSEVGGIPIDPYTFTDFERRSPILWLAIMFAVLVVVTGRWQGLRALAGLGASLAIVVFFLVPAILEGSSPTQIAFVGALAVMIATLTLTHGLGFKTLAAGLGTAVSLALTLLLANIFTDLVHLTGLASEEASFLRATQSQVSVQGLLIAGMVIGALGVLDDLTVSQSSTVMALRRANPEMGFRELYTSALGVGQDHIAATVNTLVLAYAGASLPVLLLFSLADTSLASAVNFESVAEAIVAMLVGSIGLIAAVPVTTALAALLATRLGPAELAEADPAHVHAH